LALREVLNARLFGSLRDSLGLSYDCNFDLSLFDRLEAGWYCCTVSSHPSRIQEAVTATKDVLQGVKNRPISEFELNTAKRTLIRRHESDLQLNEYWIALLTHLQLEHGNRKDLSCIRDINEMLESLTARDVQNAHSALLTDDSQIFTSVTTAGPGSSYVAGGVAPGDATGRSADLRQVD